MTSRSVAIRVYLSFLFIFLYYVWVERSRSTNFDVDYLGFLTYDSIVTSSMDLGIVYILVDFQTILTTVGFLDEYLKISTASVGHRIQLFRSAQGSF